MPNRAVDWFAQAQRDLEHARTAQGAGHHEWACFAGQQAAEKAVKAVHLSHGQEAWGHVIARLLDDLPQSPPADLIEKATVLDNFYVGTRYANGHPEGPPLAHYSPIQSNQAIQYANEILAFARDEMA